MKVEKIDQIAAIQDEMEILKTYFPQCFDKNGNFLIEKFQEIVQKNGVDISKESYSLEWLGKSYARVLAHEPVRTFMKEDKEWNAEQKNKNSQNILIKGDNLEVLKHLVNAYEDEVKMIYIDPPYNTGSDGFVYQDDRKFTPQELAKLAGIDVQKAKRILDFVNSKSNSHSAWLTFMYPRLYIARRLLKEDGAIFISIDENEFAQLKILMDEIFGEENLLSIHHIKVRYEHKSLNEKKDFQEIIEYVLIYAKNKDKVKINRPKKNYALDKFCFEINLLTEKPDRVFETDGIKVEVWLKGNYKIEKKEPDIGRFKETWISGSILKTGHGSKYLKIIEPRLKIDGYGSLYKIYGIGEDGLGFRYFTSPQNIGKTRGKMYTKIPLCKKEKILNENKALKETTIINYYDYAADFGNIRHEGGVPFNSGKKPVRLIKQFLNYFEDKKMRVLDFFAGSGTTGHAIYEKNLEDNGEREFILIQSNEVIDKRKNESKILYDFATKELGVKNPTIFEITKERLVRAAKKIVADKEKEIEEIEEKIAKIESKGKKTKKDEEKLSQLKEELTQKQRELEHIQSMDMGFKIFETIDIPQEALKESDEIKDDVPLLANIDVNTLLTTWKLYDGAKLTEEVKEIDLDGYRAYLVKDRLYLLDGGFTTQNLTTMLKKIDEDSDFAPSKIVANGYALSSKAQRELYEGILNFANKKHIELEFIVRY